MRKSKQRLEGEVGAFVQQYARKAYPTHDPNDRRYNREVEGKVRRMRPEDMDELLHGSQDEGLNKDPAIVELLAGLREALGAAAFMVVDHWEADPCAVGVAHPRNQHVLACLALGANPGSYDIHLELPAPDRSELPYAAAGGHAEVSFAEVVGIVRGHLRRAA
jgi:hypothetical protein